MSNSVNYRRVFVNIVLVALVIGVSLFVANKIMTSKPEPKRTEPPRPKLTVEAIRVARQDHQVIISSQGTVSPRTESTLIPEVAGRIVEISPAFTEGGFFARGDTLLQLDDRDYKLAITLEQSQLIQAQLKLAEEEAQVAQAQRNWQRLKQDDPADDLVLRKPQLAVAQAAVAAAEARVAREKLALERTVIKAPYGGRVLTKNVDRGQYVSPGTVLARIYAADYFEIKMPLSNHQLEYIEVPERFRDNPSDGIKGPAVRFWAEIGNRRYEWHGNIIRGQGAIDTRSRQLLVVARIDNPLQRGENDRPPLKIGQFLQADIYGEILKDVLVIPRTTLREGKNILVIDAAGRLSRREVEVVFSDQHNVVLRQGLAEDELVCLTPVVFDGRPLEVKARIVGEAEQRSELPLQAPAKVRKDKPGGRQK